MKTEKISRAKQISIIRGAFDEIPELQDGFFDVAERLYGMNEASERQHRKTRTGCGLPIKDAAKYFVVSHLIDGVESPDMYNIESILSVRNEVLYAHAYARRFRDELKPWAMKWFFDFRKVDYCELMQ